MTARVFRSLVIGAVVVAAVSVSAATEGIYVEGEGWVVPSEKSQVPFDGNRYGRPQTRNGGNADTTVSVSADNFPDILLKVGVQDASGNSVTGLTQQVVSICEQSSAETNETVEVITSFREDKTQSGISFALVFDVSGSMRNDRIRDAKIAAQNFLTSSGPNDRGSLIKFHSTVTVVKPADWVSTDADGNGTIDMVDELKGFTANGGTSVYDGAAKGVESLSQEPSPKAVIIFTDGYSYNDRYHTINSAIALANNQGVPIYTIGLGSSINSSKLEQLATSTGGTYTGAPTAQDMSAVYAAIAKKIRSQYTITYTSHNTDLDGTTRNVTVKPQGHPDGHGLYVVDYRPRIELDAETLGLSASNHLPGVDLHIKGKVVDLDAHTGAGQAVSAELYYKGATPFPPPVMTTITLTPDGAGNYAFDVTIPGASVQQPLLQYWIRATDGIVETYEPKYYNQLPHVIPVNSTPPQIDHTPLITTVEGRAVTLTADIEDTDPTDAVVSAILYVRTHNPYQQTPYFPLPMTLVGGTTYSVEIPADRVEFDGLDYFISATDRSHLRADHGTSTSPHFVAVTPEASFGASPLSGVAPLSVAFTNTSHGTIVACGWDFDNDGVTDSTNCNGEVNHTYAAPGTYTVKLTVTDADGDEASDVMPNLVTVLPPPPVAAFSGSPLAGEFPLTVTFIDESTGVVTATRWDFDGDAIDDLTNGGVSVTHTYTSVGQYSPRLTILGPGGTDQVARVDYITVSNPPAPVTSFATSPTTGVTPLTVTFTNLSSGRIDACLWDFDGDGNVDETNCNMTVQHTYTVPGDYSVVLTSAGPGGATSVTQDNAVAVLFAPPVADFSATPQTGVLPLDVLFFNSSQGNITNVMWDFDDDGSVDSTDAGAIVAYQYTAGGAGTYTVSLTVQGPGGEDTLTRPDYITTLDAVPTADFSGSPLSGVAPLTVNFVNEGSGVITNSSWDFDGDDTYDLMSVGANVSHVYTDAGIYSVKLRVDNATGSDVRTRADYIEVIAPAPVPSFTMGPSSGTIPLQVTFTNTSSGVSTNCAWDFDGNGSVDLVDCSAVVTHTYTDAGTYTVTLTQTGPGGSATATHTDAIDAQEQAPVAGIGATPLIGDAPLQVSFTNTSTGGPITSARWDFDGDGVVDATDLTGPVSHTYNAAGSYTARLTVIGPGGSDTTTVGINVVEPAPVAAFSGTPLVGQAPLTVTFTNASSGRIGKSEWDFDNDGVVDLVSSAPTVTHTYRHAADFTVKLTVTGPGGSATEIKTDYISATVPAPVAAFTANRTSGWGPLDVTFTDLSAGSITTRTWNFTGPGGTPVVNPTVGQLTQQYAPGVYTVTLTVAGPGGSDTEVKTDYITVGQTNRAPVACAGTQTIYLDSLGDIATLDASCSSDPDNDKLFYSWREWHANPVQGLIPVNSDALSQLHLSFPQPGTYYFLLRVGDGIERSASGVVFTVYVPGMKGRVISLPSDVFTVPDAEVRAYASAQDLVDRTNVVDVTISDSRGRYNLEHLEFGNTYWYTVEREGFQSLSNSVTVGYLPGDEDLGIKRGVLSSIGGVVTDQNDVPLDGVHVSVIPGLGGQIFDVTTSGGGKWTLSDIDRGMFIVQYLKGSPDANPLNGYQPLVREVNLDSLSTNLHVRMSPVTGLATLCVNTVLNGTTYPVTGARILLGNSSERHSDDEGNYTYTDVVPGFYPLQVTKDGYEPFRQNTIQVFEGSNCVTVPMTATGTEIYGTILDDVSGQPIRGAQFAMEMVAGELLNAAQTDYTGYFQLTDVPRGTNMSFRVTAPGYKPLVFVRDVPASLAFDLPSPGAPIRLKRNSHWQAPQKPHPDTPTAAVAQPFIYLNNLGESPVTLDGSPSTGTGLTYLWRESPNNPQPVLPLTAYQTPTVSAPIEMPGIYVFELQVTDGVRMSANRAAVTVFVPGLAGNVHESPTDGLEGLVDAQVRAFTNYANAVASAQNPVWLVTDPMVQEVRTAPSSPNGATYAGDFVFDGLSTGSYWIVARLVGNTAFKTYGPVKKLVNYSAAAGAMPVNVSHSEFLYEGTVQDSVSSEPIEGVRVVAAPGGRAEFFRTTTDASGEFRLPGIPGGSQVLAWYADGYRAKVTSHDITGDQISVAQTMQRQAQPATGILEGYVISTMTSTNSGQSPVKVRLAGAEVVLAGVGAVHTDANGYFQFTQLPEGAYIGRVRRKGYRTAELSSSGLAIQLAAGERKRLDDVPLALDGSGPSLSLEFTGPIKQQLNGIQVGTAPNTPPAFFKTKSGRVAKTTRSGCFEDAVSAAERMRAVAAATPETTGATSADAGGVATLKHVSMGMQDLVFFTPDGQVLSMRMNVSGDTRLSVNLTRLRQPSVYGDWATNNFNALQLTDPDVSGADADPDQDGFTNEEEFGAGTNPLDAGSHFGVDTQPAGNNAWDFDMGVGQAGREYDVYWKSNLLDTTWMPYGFSAEGDGRELVLSVTNDTTKPAMFMRGGVRPIP